MPFDDLPPSIVFQIKNAVVIVALFVKDARVMNIHRGSVQLFIRFVMLYFEGADLEGCHIWRWLQLRNINPSRGKSGGQKVSIGNFVAANVGFQDFVSRVL